MLPGITTPLSQSVTVRALDLAVRHQTPCRPGNYYSANVIPVSHHILVNVLNVSKNVSCNMRNHFCLFRHITLCYSSCICTYVGLQFQLPWINVHYSINVSHIQSEMINMWVPVHENNNDRKSLSASIINHYSYAWGTPLELLCAPKNTSFLVLLSSSP